MRFGFLIKIFIPIIFCSFHAQSASNEEGIYKFRKQNISNFFASKDHDKNGYISREEFLQHYTDATEKYDNYTADDYFSAIVDRNGDNKIDRNEFYFSGRQHFDKNKIQLDVQKLLKNNDRAFSIIDTDRSNRIDAIEKERYWNKQVDIIKARNQKFIKKSEEKFNKIDKNNDGIITNKEMSRFYGLKTEESEP